MVKNRRLLLYAFLWGVPVAVSFVLGWRLKLKGTVFAGGFLPFLLETVCLSMPAAVLAALILHGGKRYGKNSESDMQKEMEKTENQHPARRVWLFYVAVIFLCWLPVFLAYYPSVFAYDAEGQLYQVIAHDYSTHHPLLHTLFLGTFFRMGGTLGSYSAGMAVHSVVQMLLMAAAFGWALCYLYQRQIPGWIRILLLLFYGLFPANSVLALSTTKDVLFSALVMLCTVCLYRMVCDRGMYVKKKERAVYVVLMVLMLLFRNNAVYAFVVSAPVLWIGMGRIKARKAYLWMAIMILFLFAAGSVSLKAVTSAHSGSPREMLSVPLQQMARTRVEAEEELTPSMRQELEKYIPSEWAFAAYNPHLADPVKNRAVIHDNPKGLMETWIKLGMQHPAIYMDAFLDNSLGLWFLQDTSHAQVYGIGTESGFGYLSTDNRTMPAGCEIVEHSFLPGLRVFMEKIVSDNEYSKIPVVRLLFAPALYWWLLYLCILTALYRKKYREILPMVFLVAYYLTLLLSPTVLVRYMYPLMVTIPVMLPCILTDRPTNGCENTQ
ncbi:MAG: hypothetical protein K2N43_02455 [Lachnospiraceae bacterium]|nr:hypothetical protein [Lachnospiraceae bacterium]